MRPDSVKSANWYEFAQGEARPWTVCIGEPRYGTGFSYEQPMSRRQLVAFPVIHGHVLRASFQRLPQVTSILAAVLATLALTRVAPPLSLVDDDSLSP